MNKKKSIPCSITVIHGQQHKGSTYHVSRQIVEKLAGPGSVIDEYFLPESAPSYCIGCFQCIKHDERKCPGYTATQRILDSIEKSDVVIINSPTYCMEMTGQLKVLFDHWGYLWMSHRPRKFMFNKVAISISTTAGAGAKSVTRSIARQMSWLGIPVIYKLPLKVSAAGWNEVTPALKTVIENRTTELAAKAGRKMGKAKPRIRSKLMFRIMRMMQKSNTWNKTDRDYWQNAGWLAKERPWHS